MPIAIHPLIESALLDCHAYGETDVADFQDMIRQAHAAADASPRVWIHLLLDTRDISDIPSINAIMTLMRDTPTHPRIGWLLTIRNPNPTIHFPADVIAQLTRQRMRSFATIHDAIEFLKTADSTIDWALLPEEYAARDAATP